MHEWQSLSHVRWECKYHVVFIPKYRRKVLYGKLRQRIGPSLSRHWILLVSALSMRVTKSPAFSNSD